VAKIVGPLKHAAPQTLTPSGNVSKARSVDPEDTQVDAGSKKLAVVDAVKAYVDATALQKQAKKDADEMAEVIRAYVGAVRRECAVQGDYQKTWRVIGEVEDKKRLSVDVSEVDGWNIIKTVKVEDLRKEHGKEAFSAVVEEETTISIKESVLKNRALRAELSKKLEEALGVDGIREYFEKKTTFSVKEGMEQKQYSLPAEQAAVLTGLFKQTADSVKDSTSPV
jgi:hypothetical protein